MAKLVARASAHVLAVGADKMSPYDVGLLRRLVGLLGGELDFLGVSVADVEHALAPAGAKPAMTEVVRVHGSILPDQSFRQRTVTPHDINGGTIDPFVNAFLTSPANNNPFEHDVGPGGLLRFDNQLVFTYVLRPNISLSFQTRITPNVASFTQQELYTVQPAMVLNISHAGPLSHGYLRIGQLDNIESSRLGLAYRAPDATEQGPGWQNAVQPYETGVEAGGTFKSLTHFQVAYTSVDQSLIDTYAYPGDTSGLTAMKNYFLVVTPAPTSFVQFGAPGTGTPTSHTDTFTASAGPISLVHLSAKAGLGSVYVSAVNGVVCTPGGVAASGGACPIGAHQWYYIDQTNAVVFSAPLPTGTVVQISYAGPTNVNPVSRFAEQYQRNHISARVNQEIKGIPGLELGASYSRLFDTVKGTLANLPFGDGYGALSDTVVGVDARIPLAFLKSGGGHPAFFGEGAVSKYTPDFFNTPAITDSAYVLGIRLPLGPARATVQYQQVGVNFFDGAPERYLGEGPTTFAFYRGGYFPEFFGFGNNLAINRIFASTVTPGCTGLACANLNALNTFIYPVFNPFEASGPTYFSAFAPNTRGVTADVAVPVRIPGGIVVNARASARYLQEIVPNSAGQLQYGPGFSSRRVMKFQHVSGGFDVKASVFRHPATLRLTATGEHLARLDTTAYSWVPFNTASGGPDAAEAAALNAFLSVPGHTPILFRPNFVDERHTSIESEFWLPLTRAMELGLGYDAQTYGGANGTTLGANIAQHKSDSFGMLRYALPTTNNSLGFTFGNQRYTDLVLPTYNFNQNHEAIDFTSRF